MRIRSTMALVVAFVSIASLTSACLPPQSSINNVVKPRVAARIPAKSTPTTLKGGPFSTMSVMGAPRVKAADMSAWYAKKLSYTTPPWKDAAVRQLAQVFLDEGRLEGVRGDVAFAQAMVETGWLRFSARVPATMNNFSGIGAVDGGTGAASFPDIRTGVRAQIQHLRAYADSHVTRAKLARPLVDPRFDLVSPKGKANDWSKFGNGIWATDPGYSAKVLRLYSELVAFSR